MVNRYFHTALLILIFSSAIAPTNAQQYRKSDWYGGLFADYLLPTHITDFSSLPGVPNCCPQFTGGGGTGFAVGGLMQYRFYGYQNFLLRAGYMSLSADLSANEGEWVIVDDVLTPATIQHNLSSRFSAAFIEPTYKYNTIMGLSFSLGMNIGYLFSATYEQNEILVKPENQGTFENGKRIRNEQSGDIVDYNKLIYYADISAEYEIPLDKYDLYILTPRFSFNYGLNSLLKHDKWRITYFSFGLSLKYNPFIDLATPLTPN